MEAIPSMIATEILGKPRLAIFPASTWNRIATLPTSLAFQGD